jgi:20S proteasome alpha/beta subunit
MPLKPRPQIPLIRKVDRLPKKRNPHLMTLIAAFRTNLNGILLCADCQEDDGISKRVVEKIHRITPSLPSCEVFMAVSGYGAPVKDIVRTITETMWNHERAKRNVVRDHREIIESNLKALYKKHSKSLRLSPIGLTIIIAPRDPGTFPILYHTFGEELIEESTYVAHGSGKAVSDYIVSRLYDQGLPKHFLIALGLFILRETGYSSSGVGFGGDMVLINHGRKDLQYFYHQATEEVAGKIPHLSDCIWQDWATHFRFPGTWEE